MLHRREILAGIPLALAGGSFGSSFAHAKNPPSRYAPTPPEDGLAANLSGAWEIPDTSELQLVAGVPDILPATISRLSGIPTFGSAEELNRFFMGMTGSEYIGWFNSHIGGRLWWRDRSSIGGPDVESNFAGFWNGFLASNRVDIFTFIALMSIFTNEVSGNLTGEPEKGGYPNHPGISYFFDKIITPRPPGKPFRKRSYNLDLDGSNRTALSLFNDSLFNEAHANLPLSERLARSKDTAWGGAVFPQNRYSTHDDHSKSGYLLQADFYKFRGRGLFQTTWRSNYKQLVVYIQTYKGSDPLLLSYQRAWSGKDPEDVCTISRVDDWDKLFQDSSRLILGQSVRQHASTFKYLPLNISATGLNGGEMDPGSLMYMGLRIGGSDQYASTFKARVGQIYAALVEQM